jgi:hypothetical protein
MNDGKYIGLTASLLTVAYAVYIILHFFQTGAISFASLESFAGYVSTLIVTPHILCVSIASVFGFVGVFEYKRWAILASGILMVSAAVLFLTYAPFVVIQAAIFFISYARMIDY